MRRASMASTAGVVAAFGASLCCIGPILFVTLGVGAGLASTFGPLRPIFTALMVLGLAVGFYTVYGRSVKSESCSAADVCERPRSRRREKIVIWSATVLAVVFWTFNYWSILLV